MNTKANQLTDTPQADAVLGPSEGEPTTANTLSLQRHLQRVDVFKVGLRNSFGIDFRHARRRVTHPERPGESQLFCYLGEVLPLVQPRSQTLEQALRKAYSTLEQEAEESFWIVYSDFLPMVHSIADSAGIEPQEVDPILGRAILLFDASRRTKFVTYLEKTLRESIKNLRGRRYAEELGIPLSAGRLVQQILWRLDQLSMALGRRLSREESESETKGFLRAHRTKFSELTIARVAAVVLDYRSHASLDSSLQTLEPSADCLAGQRSDPNDLYVEEHEERQFQWTQLIAALDRGRFTEEERSILLQRLDLPYDEACYSKSASKVTEASLRKRKQRLLVRLMAAKFAPQAPRFGSFLLKSATKSRDSLREHVGEVAKQLALTSNEVASDLLNWMSLSESVYRISITDRNRLESYLLSDEPSPLLTPLFRKLVAVLIEQERLGFPCLGSNQLGQSVPNIGQCSESDF